MTRFNVPGLIAAAMTLALFVHQTDTNAAQGEAIFNHALKVAQSDAHARYATYQVVVTFTNGAHHTDAWDTTEDMTHASVYADIFSQQERADPVTPHGTNIGLSAGLSDSSPRSLGANNGKPSTDPAITSGPLNGADTSDPVGPVAFAVDQNFGLTAPRPYVVVHEGETFSSRADGYTTIGRTGAEAKRYRIELNEIDGNVAHLTLTPLTDPYHNRLRELWVETDTGYVREATVQGVGDREPIDKARFKVTFFRKDGGAYIAKECAMEPIAFGDNDTVPDLCFSFEGLALTSLSPKYTFGISTSVQTLHDP
jgi:hypothetical protein